MDSVERIDLPSVERAALTEADEAALNHHLRQHFASINDAVPQLR